MPGADRSPAPDQRRQGDAHIRGETIPVLDLSEAIGRKPIPEEDRPKTFLIVVEYNRRTLAFMVRKVDRILNTQWDQIMAPPEGDRQRELPGPPCLSMKENWSKFWMWSRSSPDLYPMPTEVSDDVATPEERTRAHQYNVLIVDDSAVARNQMQRSLENLGVKVSIANNGRQALEMLQRLLEKGWMWRIFSSW